MRTETAADALPAEGGAATCALLTHSTRTRAQLSSTRAAAQAQSRHEGERARRMDFRWAPSDDPRQGTSGGWMARVAIVGCGAMGSVYAALMADAGHEVFGITLWPDHAAAIRERGLRVEGASGDRTVRIQAGTSTEDIGPCDLVVIATKAFDVEAAGRSALPLIGPQ